MHSVHLRLTIAVALAAIFGAIASARQNATITLQPGTRLQTFHGWEAAVLSGISNFSSITDANWSAIFDLATAELGINRVRLAIKAGVEGPGSGEDAINDNSDPNVINPAGFNWTDFDWRIDHIVNPWRKKVTAAGIQPYVVLNYVDFDSSPFDHNKNPQEYGEFMLAVFQHMQSKYGWVPNAIEPSLEPDNGPWTPTVLANCIVAAAQRLQANGFAVPDFIAPSTSNMGAALTYIDGMMSVSAAVPLIKEFAYHRYGQSTADLQAIASRAVQHGKRTSMLEYWTDGANYRTLHQDLTVGRNSAWQQGVFADNFGCASSHFIRMSSGVPQLCPNTRILRQYMKYIRPGAQRIGASTVSGVFDPVAFINTDGRWVVVIASDGGSGSFSIGGLPGGTYSLSYTEAGGTQATTNLPSVTLVAGQNLSTSLPAAGAFTIVSASGGSAPPLPLPPPPPPTGPTAPPAIGGCSTPDPFVILGGGTCVNGGWFPPGLLPPSEGSSPPPPPPPPSDPTPPSATGGCSTPDPFAILGGGTCVNGGWLPPGLLPPSGGSSPPPPPSPLTGGCSTPDPFVILGGGTCVNGGWLPPGSGGGSSTPGGCTTPDPFVVIGGGICINGGWHPKGRP